MLQKRKREQSPSTSEKEAKRQRIPETTVTIASLSDEWNLIFEYFEVKDFLTFSSTNKSNYQRVSTYAKNSFAPPFPEKETWHWTLSSSLQQFHQYAIAPAEELDFLQQYTAKYHVLPSPCLNISNEEIKRVTEILATKRPEKQPRMVPVKLVSFKPLLSSETTSSANVEFETKIIEMQQTPVGFAVKKLTLCSEQVGANMGIVKLLSNLQQVEYLNFGDALDYTEGNEDIDTVIQVPILSRLKEVVIDPMFEIDCPTYFLDVLLHVAPNLRTLRFTYTNEPGDELLELIAKRCPNLEALLIEGDSGATPCPHFITDDGVLKLLQALPHLKKLELSHCADITGALLLDIGKYSPNLEVLSIERVGYERNMVDAHPELYIGGGLMPNLKTLLLNGSWETISAVKLAEHLPSCAPNLEEFVIGEGSSEAMEAILDTCKNLKRVTIYTDSESIMKKASSLASLEYVRFVTASTTKFLKHHWPSVRHLELGWYLSVETIAAQLADAFPNLVMLGAHSGMSNLKTLAPILDDTSKWPNLKEIYNYNIGTLVFNQREDAVGVHALDEEELKSRKLLKETEK